MSSRDDLWIVPDYRVDEARQFRCSPLTNERVSRAKLRESAEVSVRCEKFAHAVSETEGSNSGVVHAGAGNASRLELRSERHPVTTVLADEGERRRLHPRLDLVAGQGQ